MKKLVIVVSTVIFLNSWSVAGITGILEGRVIDKRTRDPLVGVNVFVKDSRFGTTTDIQGFYRINNIRAQAYDVQFSLMGYGTVLMKSVVIQPDLRNKIDVEMSETNVEMGTVEIIAQKPLIQTDQPATAYSIGSPKIDKLPVTTFQEIISLQPGVTLEGNVRGGKVNEVTYVVDGVSVQDNISGGLGTDLPKGAISGLTIYTGGFEAEYGNALSGVVSVVTKSGNNIPFYSFRYDRDQFLPAKTSQQTDRAQELEVTSSGPIVRDGLFYLTSNTIRLSDTRWWQDFDNFFPSPLSRELAGITKFDYVLTDNDRFTAQAVYSLKKWFDYEYSWRFNLDGLPRRSRNSWRYSLSYSHIFSQYSTLTSSLSRMYIRSKVSEKKVTDLVIEPYAYDLFLRFILDGEKNWWADSRQLIYTWKSDFVSTIDKSHFLKTGFEINMYDIFSDLVKYEPQTTYFGKPLENAPLLNYSNSYSYFPRTGHVYVQDKMEFLGDGSSLSLGLRWDFLDPRASRPIVEYVPKGADEYFQVPKGSIKAKFKHQTSPRLAFVTPISTASIIYINYGQYFQYPLFDYLYSGINPSQLRDGARSVLVGNPDLEPERTSAWEIGYKSAIDEHFVASVTYFRKNTKNQIDSKTLVAFDSKFAGDYGFASYVNNAEAEASGIEFVLSRERDEKLSGSISYSYMTTEGTSEVANQSINLAQWGFPIRATQYPLSWDQRHTVKFDVESNVIFGIQTNMIVLYNSPRPYTYFPTRDGFTPIDSTKDFVPNNFRMKDVIIANLKFSKDFSFGEQQVNTMKVYVDIRNLFNAKNVRWIDSNGNIGGELSDPSAYYDLRRVRGGFTIDF